MGVRHACGADVEVFELHEVENRGCGHGVPLRCRFGPSMAASPVRTARAPVAASGPVEAPVNGSEGIAVAGAIVVFVVAVAVKPSVVMVGAAWHVSVTLATSLVPGPRLHVAYAVMGIAP